MDSQSFSTLYVIGMFASLSVLGNARVKGSGDEGAGNNINIFEYRFDDSKIDRGIRQMIAIVSLSIFVIIALKFAGARPFPKSDLMLVTADLIGAVVSGWTSAGTIIAFIAWWQGRRLMQMASVAYLILVLATLLYVCRMGAGG
ncbi:hypothetical protein [Stieleria varia]|uniref:Uncharacterized protein n=1 Tax=Stieleria varia TaxID=2528005 RepID=A0A5C6B7V4_9BACT|nr:hypothetical protein [Stieleria varia]TWU07887.1 hypothetical protein Pla52n_04630 [Stieleria varia]